MAKQNTADIAHDATDLADDVEKRKVPKEMRPLYTEIARLSSALKLARNACYEGAPARAVKALARLERMCPDVREVAEMLAEEVDAARGE